MEKETLIEQYKLDKVKKRLDEMNSYIERMDEAGEGNMPQEEQPEEEAAPQEQGQGMPQNMPQQLQQAPQQTQGQEGEMPGMEGNAPENVPEEEVSDEDMEVEVDDPEAVETEEMEAEDEVIDIDDLTTSQENTEIEINSLSKNLTTLLNVVGELKDAIDNNDRKVDELRKEYERRNPTEEERANLRRKMGAPYDTTTGNYWNDKSAQIYDNNMVDPRQDTEERVYEITLDDVNNESDASVAKSINYPRKLTDYISF